MHHVQGNLVCSTQLSTSTFIYRTNDTEKTGPQIALLVLAEQSYETITMKVKMNNKFNRGDFFIFTQIVPNR